MAFVANAWRGAPFFAIVILAALQSIDAALYEAADIDGASRWQKFRYVTMPLILNAVVIATLLRALWTFNFIDLLWTMTRGGPAGTTTDVADLHLRRGLPERGVRLRCGVVRGAVRHADRLQLGVLAAQPADPAMIGAAAFDWRTRRKIDRALTIGVPVAFFLVFTLFPIYWLVNSSLKPGAELFTYPPGYWPDAPTIANYVAGDVRERGWDSLREQPGRRDADLPRALRADRLRRLRDGALRLSRPQPR